MSDDGMRRLLDLASALRVTPGRTVDLRRDFDPGDVDGELDRDGGDELLATGVEMLSEYQRRLAAQDVHGLLVVLQGPDASGKDGTIRHVMSGVDPQGVVVHSFQEPTHEELDHDYLWRCAKRLPARGQIGIFNRSYYEEVLIVRVRPELLDPQRLPEHARGPTIWRRRFGEINDWEHYLVDNGFRIVKLFLNLSKGEQRERFLARIDDPEKHWKFTAGDVEARSRWDGYQRAYSEMLSNTSTEWAPWHVVPADRKWYARIAAAAIIVDALVALDPRYPPLDDARREEMARARARLETEQEV